MRHWTFRFINHAVNNNNNNNNNNSNNNNNNNNNSNNNNTNNRMKAHKLLVKSPCECYIEPSGSISHRVNNNKKKKKNNNKNNNVQWKLTNS